MPMPISKLLVLGLSLTRPVNPGPAVDRDTKVTWGTVTDVVQEVGVSTYVVLSTPSGPRVFTAGKDGIPLRGADGRLVGYAEALRPGDRVRAFFNLGPAGQTLPVEFVLGSVPGAEPLNESGAGAKPAHRRGTKH